MSGQIDEMRECCEEIEKPSGNKNKIKMKKMVKFKDDKEKVIHNKGVLNRVISKEAIKGKNITSAFRKIPHSTGEGVNITEKFGVSKKETDNIVFKVPKMLPRKNSISNGNHIFMRKRAESISKSLTISSQRDCRSSQEILKQIAAKTVKTRLQRIKNNSLICESRPISQQHQLFLASFDGFVPSRSGELTIDKKKTESK
uniref:Uncharacterized protein n=1 Tax=Strongyloides papillosus TaxID=174720 RepID=A0A0N5C9Y2_STREA